MRPLDAPPRGPPRRPGPPPPWRPGAPRRRLPILPATTATAPALSSPDSLAREPAPHDALLRRELYFFGLYRLLEAGLLCLLTFSPVGLLISDAPRLEGLGRIAALGYVAGALTLLWLGRRATWPGGRPAPSLAAQAGGGLGLDICVAVLAIHVLPGIAPGVALLLVFNIGAAALFLSLRGALALAALAAAAVLLQWVAVDVFSLGGPRRPLVESAMYAITYLATALFTHQLGRQMRETHALAEKRGAEVANLSEINELIIRRMRTGLMVVDARQRIRLANEAAWLLTGTPSPNTRDLPTVSPELARRLRLWRLGRPVEETAVALAPEVPEVIPRFARLTLGEEMALIFLDDTTLVSRRAEEITLSALGRLSASIAHEIRNPLASISYAAQLLDEGEGIIAEDRRLLEIIHTQCQRMNGIVQNVLDLAKRERSQPEPIELVGWARRFVEDYRASHPLETDELHLVTEARSEVAVVDPEQLHQVVTALVHNALTYGRLPGAPARVTLAVRMAAHTGQPMLEVVDRGPGIPAKVVPNLFQPFYTTSEHGTGLGLYIARQLCEANQGTLNYETVPGGGSCFRIHLARPRALAGDEDGR